MNVIEKKRLTKRGVVSMREREKIDRREVEKEKRKARRKEEKARKEGAHKEVHG